MSHDARQVMASATLLTAARGTGQASARRNVFTSEWTLTLPGQQGYTKDFLNLEKLYTELAPAQRYQSHTAMVLEAIAEMAACADDGQSLYTATRTGRSWVLRTPSGDSAQVEGDIGHVHYTLTWLALGSIVIEDGRLVDLDL